MKNDFAETFWHDYISELKRVRGNEFLKNVLVEWITRIHQNPFEKETIEAHYGFNFTVHSIIQILQ